MKMCSISNKLLFPFFRDPNKQYPDDEHDLPSIRWPEYTAHGREYLVLSSTDKSTGRGLRAKECAFWNNFLPKLAKFNGKYFNRNSLHS